MAIIAGVLGHISPWNTRRGDPAYLELTDVVDQKGATHEYSGFSEQWTDSQLTDILRFTVIYILHYMWN